ncbi:hypothetical protein ABFX02_03G053400 [Erythranthe guttata]
MNLGTPSLYKTMNQFTKNSRAAKNNCNMGTCSNYVFLCFFFLSVASQQSISKAYETYIVHMDVSLMPKPFTSHHSWYTSSLATVADSSSPPSSSRLLYTYSNAINGFSAILSSAELEAVKTLPGYLSSTKDKPVKLDTTHSYRFLGLNHDHGAWPASNYGDNVIIGLVDTGIWPESKSFKDDGIGEIPSRWRGVCESCSDFNSSLCNRKLIGARSFGKGMLAKKPEMSMSSPRDTEGHGTHTSSTAAGNYVEDAAFYGYAAGTARGVAPKARIAMYKVVSGGDGVVSDVLAAVDQAIDDGVDVLSMSLGFDSLALDEDPIAVGAFAAMEKGIFVSTSAGNVGPNDGTLHNGYPWVLNVAAGTLDRKFEGTLHLSDGYSVTGQSLYPGKFPAEKYFSIVYVVACQNEGSLEKARGKIVVCLDTTNTLGLQVVRVQNSSVVGAVFVSNDTDTIEFFIHTTTPTLFLELKQGKKLVDYITNGSPEAKQASFKFHETRFNAKPSPQLAKYSSRGPSRVSPYILKPDILAPGDSILASWSPVSPIFFGTSKIFFGNFNIISGTSMSCPHAAGVAALLKGAHPRWSPAAVRSAMMTTSYVLDNMNNSIQDLGSQRSQPASPLGIGAGHIDPNKALNPGLVYDTSSEDYVNLLCAMNFTKNQIQTITRSVISSCTNPSLDLNYPSFITFSDANGTNSVREFRRTVTYVGQGSSVYTARISEFYEGLSVRVSPDTIEFKRKFEKKNFTLTIEGKMMNKTFGSLSWVESKGNIVVRSPIVIM